MSIPRITIVLIFLFGMLTGCHTPLIDVQVDVRSGVQPRSGSPGGGCEGIPWYLCGGGGIVDRGVLQKIVDTGERTVYEVAIEGQDRRVYFSVPPDEVEDGLKENDEVAFEIKDPRNKLGKLK